MFFTRLVNTGRLIWGMKDFKRLRIWQNGMKIAATAYKLVESFPPQERFTLSNQITKAAVSIPSNIAEESSRSSERDYSRFVEIALGSSFELETQILISEALNFGNAEIRKEILVDIEQEQMMLQSFLLKLKK
jgi:four helix bundle protein